MDFPQSKILTTSILYDLRSTVTSAAAMGEDDAFAEFIARLTMKRAQAFPAERHLILQYNRTKRLGAKYLKQLNSCTCSWRRGLSNREVSASGSSDGRAFTKVCTCLERPSLW